MADQRDDYQQDEEDDKKWDENFHASQSASDSGLAERQCKDFMNKPGETILLFRPGPHKNQGVGPGLAQVRHPAPCYHPRLNLKRDFEDESL